MISNVPGAREPLYWKGARLDGNYPMSIALDGQALNITLSNNADNLDFGLVGCRRSVPHLQRLLGHLGMRSPAWKKRSGSSTNGNGGDPQVAAVSLGGTATGRSLRFRRAW